MRKGFLLALAMAVLVGLAAPASAAVIFSDNFTRSDNDTVGNSWFEQENDSNDVKISNNQLRLRDFNPEAAAWRTVTGTGWTNIVLSFSWTDIGEPSSSDKFYVAWRLGNSGSYG